jgi:hypothetical protein
MARVISVSDILENAHSNPSAAWGKGKDSNEPGTDPNCASARLHKPTLKLHISEPTSVSDSTLIFAMGSCFAREVEAAFLRRGIAVASRPRSLVALERGWEESALTNRYNTPSMLLEFRRLLESPSAVPDDALLIPIREDTWMDAHYHEIFSGPIEQILERRRRFHADLQALREADIVILTLGLNEAPFDPACGLYRNVAPTPRELKSKGRVEVHVLSTRENLEALDGIRSLIKQHCKPTAKLIVTVSPVPLTRTFTKDDAIVANAAGKSVLRAAVHEFCSLYGDAIYFPSYEIALNADHRAVFKGDKRHIHRKFVDQIVSQFAGAS